jgi:hypothetical protein
MQGHGALSYLKPKNHDEYLKETNPFQPDDVHLPANPHET